MAGGGERRLGYPEDMAAKAKRKTSPKGKPHYKFTDADRALVSKMVAVGATRPQISKALGCSPATLRRHFAPLIDGRNPSGPRQREYTDQDRNYVSEMISYGIIHAEIAKVMGISLPTLRTDFPEEIATAQTKANSKVAGSLFRNATEYMSVQAQKFWLKTRAGWIEAGEEEHEVHEEPDLRASIGDLDQEGRDAMRTVLEKLGARSELSGQGPEPGETIQ